MSYEYSENKLVQDSAGNLLHDELGWEPSLQFEDGIEKTIRWYLENQSWMDNVTSGDYMKYYEDMYSNR